MLTIISPRIANLGDFANCLPVLSGLSKSINQKIHFVICDRLERFKGIKELLMCQDMFGEVTFFKEQKFTNGLLIDDTGHFRDTGNVPMVTTSYANFIRDTYNYQFDIDADFELQVPKLDIDYHQDKFVIGDRWSPKFTNDIDMRREFNVIESSGIFKDHPVHYLDYTNDLVYNCSLVKYNKNSSITTFTGIGILSDLMNKDQYVLWGDDIKNFDNKTIEFNFARHHFLDRKSKLMYINDFDMKDISANTTI